MKKTKNVQNHECSKRFAKSHRRGGQALVEMALCLLVLMPILIGIIEFGWLMKNVNQLGNAAREGARAAAVARTTKDIKMRVGNMAAPLVKVDSDGNVTKGTITLTVAPSSDNSGTYPNTLGDTMDTTSGTPVALKNNANGSDLIKVTVVTPNPSLTRFFPYLHNRPIVGVGVMRREF